MTSAEMVRNSSASLGDALVSESLRHEIVQWDVPTWWRPMEYFGTVIRERGLEGGDVLEIGARDGGTALYLAKYFDMRVVATDIDPIEPKCRPLHDRHGVGDRITYGVADATALPYADATFDVVVVKSVLGGIAAALGPDAMYVAAGEMARVLRPGGVVLFAENLAASWLHRKARRLRAWNGEWHYPDIDEVIAVFSRIGSPVARSTGFMAVFVPESLPRLKAFVAACDGRLEHVLPARWQYAVFGEVPKSGG